MLNELKLLGKVFLLKEGEKTILTYRRTLLLVTYLLCHDTWQNREELQLLFWPEDDARQGGNKLRQLLHRTKQEEYAAAIEVSEDAVRFEIVNDVQKFRNAFANNQWQEAVALYQGELLSGMQAKGLDNYQEWLDSERNDLKQLWRDASLQCCEALSIAEEHVEAAQLLKTVLDTDFLDEDVLQAYLEQLGLSGQRSLAIKCYEEFKTQLWTELQLEPLEETQQLIKAIQSSPAKESEVLQEEDAVTTTASQEIPVKDIQAEDLAIQASLLVSSASQPEAEKSSLLGIIPSFNTAFVGRDIELAELSSGLQDSECRLQTLLGFGGVGKTRLAVELFQQADQHFADGAVFVALAGISADKDSSREQVVPQVASAILQALSIEQPAQQNAQTLRTRLLTTLKHQQMLIVLDNFEHVMPATELIIEILETAPQVKVLVTSREALGLYFEHIFDISGMASPPLDNIEHIEIYDAVQLFIRSARRVKADFVLTDTSKLAVAQICNMLQGSPLALELAAAWVRLMPPFEIVEELSRNLDILESNYPDLPQRHRSLGAIFEHSWELLSIEEQSTLQNLAIFEGSFSKDAAVAVTGASLRSMFSLVNKSLLKRDETGRFSRHLVVDEYSKQRLLVNKELHQELATKHADYFANWISEIIDSNEQTVWIEEISENYSNVEAALRWYETSRNDVELLQLIRVASQFWTIRSHYINLDAENWYSKILKTDLTEENPKAYATVLNRYAFLLIHKRPQESKELLIQAVKISEKANIYDASSEAYTLLTYIASHHSQREEAYEYIENSLQAAELSKESAGTRAKAHARLNRGLLYIQDAKYDLAKLDFEHSLIYYQNEKENFGRANSLINLGLIAIYTEQYEEAKAYYLETLELNKHMNNMSSLAMSYNNLGFATGRLGQFEEAIDFLLKGLKICEEQYFNALKIATHNSIGMVAALKEDIALANFHYSTALALSNAADNFHNQVEALEGLATLLTKTQQFEGAAQLFTLAESIRSEKSLMLPQSEKELIEGSLQEVKGELGEETFNDVATVEKARAYMQNLLDTTTQKTFSN